MKILHESATGAEIVQAIETVLDSDLLTPEQKREMRGLQENVMTLDANVKEIRLSEQYLTSEKEKVQQQLEEAQKLSQMLILSRHWRKSSSNMKLKKSYIDIRDYHSKNEQKLNWKE